MDARTRARITDRGGLPGIWIYITGRPDNDRVTLFDRVVTSISRVAMFLILAGVLITFYEVLMRYLFASPTLWANELTLWVGSAIYLAAGVYTMQRRAHIRITAVYDIVSPKVRLAFDYMAIFVLVVYAVLMVVGGYDVAGEAFITWERFGTIFDPPIPATIKPLVLIVTCVVALGALNNMLVDWYGRGQTDPERQEHGDRPEGVTGLVDSKTAEEGREQ